MKIQPRYFPIIILTTFVLFVLLGLLLGFRPQHGGGSGHRSVLEGLQYTPAAFTADVSCATVGGSLLLGGFG